MKIKLIVFSLFACSCLKPSVNEIASLEGTGNDTISIVKPNERGAKPPNLNSIYLNKSWEYLIVEDKNSWPRLSWTKLIVVDSIATMNDSVVFSTTEITIDNHFKEVPNDTTKHKYLELNGTILLISNDNSLSEPGIYFRDGFYNPDSLKEYTGSNVHFLYYLEYSNKIGIPFQTESSTHRLLYVEKIGLVESTDSSSFIWASHPEWNVKTTKLISVDGKNVDSNIYDSLK